MSKKKGVSLDDKRDRILEIFHDSCDVFVLKDIEKMGMKKGVVLQSIKDVLQGLVDDDLVHQEKIGISNYFWSFPSEASVKMQNANDQLEGQLATVRQKITTTKNMLETEKACKPVMVDQAAQLAKLRDLRQKVATLESELLQYRDNNPETLEAMRQGIIVAKEAANRWLDNLFSMQSWCKRQFPGSEDELASFFKENGFVDDLDYLE